MVEILTKAEYDEMVTELADKAYNDIKQSSVVDHTDKDSLKDNVDVQYGLILDAIEWDDRFGPLGWLNTTESPDLVFFASILDNHDNAYLRKELREKVNDRIGGSGDTREVKRRAMARLAADVKDDVFSRLREDVGLDDD